MTVLEAAVGDAADEYVAAASAAALHTLGHLKKKPDDLQARSDLIETYEQRMVPPSSPGNDLYSKLRSVPHARCPLCGQRLVESLDHQLPKKKYPLLAVVPSNLVPACSTCNWLKGEKEPTTAEEQTLHPYFDDVTGQQWLFARVNESDDGPPAIVYVVQTPDGWNDVLAARVQYHVRTFALKELFGTHAASEMSNNRSFLASMDSKERAAFLARMSDSIASDKEAGGLNHWRRVMYQTLAGNPWYIEGGYARF
ncbi:HNH endonuclease [Streptomyces violascens]|uniref:HNH endonuclease n=1 Tax=Streptomyces violascens TaxID=67381 RepID=UPI0036CD8D2B